MDTDGIQRLLELPSESLNVEIKNWIDPFSEEGKEKIVRAVAAIHNQDGGYLIIGLDDRSRKAAPSPPADPRSGFREDDIQSLISRHLSEPVPVSLHFPLHEGVVHPVIGVPSGVRTPTVVKRPIGRTKEGEVLVRTLRSGGVVSTAGAMAGDWPRLMQACFDNRDADIAAFVRRHLGATDLEGLRALLGTAGKSAVDWRSQVREALDFGAGRFGAVVADEEMIVAHDAVSHAWGCAEAALVISPAKDEALADRRFRQALEAADPQYGGMALWYDASRRGPEFAPHVKKGAWESFVRIPDGYWRICDFMRADPIGMFYQRRLHDTDATADRRGATPGKTFDPVWAVQGVAEAMAVGLHYALALGWAAEDAMLRFGFRWSGLSGRRLVSVGGDERTLLGMDVASDDGVESFIEVPLATAPTSVTQFAVKVLAPALALFGGYTMRQDYAERVVRKRLNRES